MRKDVYYVILCALETLLEINKSTDGDDLSKAKNNHIDSTIKMIEEIIEREGNE